MANTWDLTDTGKDSMQKGKRLSESGSEVRETQSGYCTSYRTNDGGAGYAYTPFRDGTEGAGKRRRAGNPHKRRIAVGSVLAAAFLGLCFLGGYAGATLAGARTPADSSGLTSFPGTVPNIENQSPKGNKEGSAVGGYTTEAEVISAVSDSVVLLRAETYEKNLEGEEELTAATEASGVIFSGSGYILTTAHDIDGSTAITARLSDGAEFEAGVVGYDTSSDIAVLKINAGDRELKAVEFGCSADLVAGEKVVIIGNPHGYGKLTVGGMISAVDVTCEVPLADGKTMTLIPVASSADTGVFGGGMFNMDGKLVGLINSENKESGLGFAIPVDSLVKVVNELCRYGYVRGVVDHGLSIVDVTEKNLNYCRYLYGITEIGVYVVTSKYSDAIENKDRIVSVDGQEVTTCEEFRKIVTTGYAVGDTLHLVIRRGGRNFTVDLVLHEYIPAGIKVLET